MISIGALLGVGLIVLDALLNLNSDGASRRWRGIGIYLPMSAAFAVVVGAVVGHWYNKRGRKSAAPQRLSGSGLWWRPACQGELFGPEAA
jgi:uncharacterized oligopeptide transporter (OPT) family protein